MKDKSKKSTYSTSFAVDPSIAHLLRDSTGINGCPIGTRTPTKGARNLCATITPSDNLKLATMGTFFIESSLF